MTAGTLHIVLAFLLGGAFFQALAVAIMGARIKARRQEIEGRMGEPLP
ncbi:hypothetical protein Gdia_2436 [Gluconacetobacter diazotrophicus PA1 5]|nr:hypothetical protein [Gluconacetobacter diazotrophicus]ACI52182.1 hypothetical protein Gdia_2436 [Gluconacetobacter diazotrophicus PA1 5]TWA98223.1 hypothetical protein FBZ86_14914 [Gluconacetobacter diazotrophicus]